MMDHNCIYLSGWCDKSGINDTKFGPNGWALIKLQQIKGEGYDIPAHSVFIGMNLATEDAAKTAKNKDAFAKIQNGGFLTVWDASVDSYVKHGETKVNRRIKASPTRFIVTKDAGVSVNLAAFFGKIVQAPNDEWAELQCTHRPGPKAKPNDPWPSSSVKVYLPGGNIKVKVGHYYFIAGKVAGKSPSGKDDLILVASVANGV